MGEEESVVHGSIVRKFDRASFESTLLARTPFNRTQSSSILHPLNPTHDRFYTRSILHSVNPTHVAILHVLHRSRDQLYVQLTLSSSTRARCYARSALRSLYPTLVLSWLFGNRERAGLRTGNKTFCILVRLLVAVSVAN